jgi:hypothetical protein
MENLIAENVSLREILNNLNSNLYDVNDYDKIRITSKNKPDFVILTVEADASENIVKFFEDNNYFQKEQNKIKFEKTFNDYVVLSLDSEGEIINSSIISLFELILSSEIINLEESEKWLLDTPEFTCVEIDYVLNKENEISTDMKILG